jgi:antitoxin ParD1/3/4
MRNNRPMGINLSTVMPALTARHRTVEVWLHTQVGPAYDVLKADPSRAVSVDQVRARLAAEHAKTN